jgi:hypothetical protein
MRRPGRGGGVTSGPCQAGEANHVLGVQCRRQTLEAVADELLDERARPAVDLDRLDVGVLERLLDSLAEQLQVALERLRVRVNLDGLDPF